MQIRVRIRNVFRPIVQVICHEKWPPLIIFFSFTTAVCHWKWSSQKLWWLGYYTQIRNRRAGNNFSPRFTTGPGLINHDEQKKVNSNSLQLQQLSFIPGTMLMKKERIFSGCCDGVAPHNGVQTCLKSHQITRFIILCRDFLIENSSLLSTYINISSIVEF